MGCGEPCYIRREGNWVKVTVIVAVHNGEFHIGRAIRSMLEQSMAKKDYEILVVNDGSTDNTLRVLNSFGDWIRVVNLDQHVGLPAACNIGLREAHSRFVVRVDADDYVHEDLLKVEYLFLSMNSAYDAVACDYLVVNEREEVGGRVNSNEHPIACGVMFRLDALVKIGLYDEQFLLHEDLDLRIRFLQKHTLKRIELPLYRYRKHAANMTNDQRKVTYYTELLEQKHGELAKCLTIPA
jgi:glycosyltransferase involved in cell wall biosynthesis